jgi:hypothetical protein
VAKDVAEISNYMPDIDAVIPAVLPAVIAAVIPPKSQWIERVEENRWKSRM